MFVNTLVLRSDVDPHLSFTEFLRATVETDLAAMAHADIPFERVVAAVDLNRSTARHPLFQVAITLQPAALPPVELAGVQLHAEALAQTQAKFDLELRATESADGGCRFEFGYCTDVFDEPSVARIADRFGAVLAAVTTDQDVIIGDIDVLSAAERTAIAPARGHMPTMPVTLADYFGIAVACHRHGIALRSGATEVTYQELDERTNRVARALISRGIGSEDVVALGLTRSIESVVGVLGVAKTGAAYLPVDPRYPTDRIRHMLTDSCVDIGLTVAPDSVDLPGDIEWLVLDELDGFGSAPIDDTDLVRPIRIANTAYVVYTSGSTGVPKGVAVSHRGLSNYAAEQRHRFGVTSASRTLHLASPSFDAAVLELLLASVPGRPW